MPRKVGAGLWIAACARQRHAMQNAVELAVPAPIQTMAFDVARGSLERGGPGEHGGSGLRTKGGRVPDLPENLGGGHERDPAEIGQRGLPPGNLASKLCGEDA